MGSISSTAFSGRASFLRDIHLQTIAVAQVLVYVICDRIRNISIVVSAAGGGPRTCPGPLGQSSTINSDQRSRYCDQLCSVLAVCDDRVEKPEGYRYTFVGRDAHAPVRICRGCLVASQDDLNRRKIPFGCVCMGAPGLVTGPSQKTIGNPIHN